MKSWLLSILLLSVVTARLVFAFSLTDWGLPNVSELEFRYETSQYCLAGLRQQFALDPLLPEYAQLCGDGTVFDGNIDDPELYTLAGVRYIAGASPTSINWELQPLSKYLFGLATLLGISPLLLQWLMLLLLLALIYLFGRRLSLSPALSLVAPTLLVFDNLILEQLSHPYLDLTQTTLTLLALYVLAHALSTQKPFVFFAFVLGLVALAKSFSLGIILALVGGIVVLPFNKHRVVSYLTTLAISILVYLAGYTQFFITHGIFNLDFVNLHLTILKFYKSYVPEYPLGEIWRVLLLGQWQTWWGKMGLVPVSEWSLLWPLAAVATALVTLKQGFQKNPFLTALLLWALVYLVFGSVRLVFPRYLVAVLPVLYLMLVYGTHLVLQKLGKKLS